MYIVKNFRTPRRVFQLIRICTNNSFKINLFFNDNPSMTSPHRLTLTLPLTIPPHYWPWVQAPILVPRDRRSAVAWFLTFPNICRWLLNYWPINLNMVKTARPPLPTVTTLQPLTRLTSPSRCVLFISTSGSFGQTKGCSFTPCLLAATQSKIMPAFALSLLPTFLPLNRVSVVGNAADAQRNRLTQSFLIFYLILFPQSDLAWPGFYTEFFGGVLWLSKIFPICRLEIWWRKRKLWPNVIYTP